MNKQKENWINFLIWNNSGKVKTFDKEDLDSIYTMITNVGNSIQL